MMKFVMKDKASGQYINKITRCRYGYLDLTPNIELAQTWLTYKNAEIHKRNEWEIVSVIVTTRESIGIASIA